MKVITLIKVKLKRRLMLLTFGEVFNETAFGMDTNLNDLLRPQSIVKIQDRLFTAF